MKVVVSILLVCIGSVACTSENSRAPALEHDKTTPSQWAISNPTWVTPIAPHRIIDNVYYVGSEGIGSYLITTDEGHIVLDGGLPENAAMIIESIAMLGFDITDVTTLINSHAHFDHSGGLAELKAKSGATLVAMEGDRSALENGYYLGFEDDQDLWAPKVAVDRTIADGATLAIGGTTLTANLTPGHSRGCTTWTMTAEEAGQTYEVLFFCSASVAANRLVPPQYEGVVNDYRTTFAKSRTLRPDVPLSNHPNFYFRQLEKIREASDSPEEARYLAFVDRQSFSKTMHSLEQRFVRALIKQRDDETLVSAFAFDETQLQPDAKYVFYLHGRIIEDQGLAAVSERFGAYQYLDILQAFEAAGFAVISEPRGPATNPKDYAEKLVQQIELLLRRGVAIEDITVVGASKGAYIAALVSNELQLSGLKTLLLAGCHESVVEHMRDNNIRVYGHFLAIRDRADVDGAGSCDPVFTDSPGVSTAKQLLLDTGLSHGIIYQPLEDWLAPFVAWQQDTN